MPKSNRGGNKGGGNKPNPNYPLLDADYTSMGASH